MTRRPRTLQTPRTARPATPPPAPAPLPQRRPPPVMANRHCTDVELSPAFATEPCSGHRTEQMAIPPLEGNLSPEASARREGPLRSEAALGDTLTSLQLLSFPGYYSGPPQRWIEAGGRAPLHPDLGGAKVTREVLEACEWALRNEAGGECMGAGPRRGVGEGWHAAWESGTDARTMSHTPARWCAETTSWLLGRIKGRGSEGQWEGSGRRS